MPGTAAEEILCSLREVLPQGTFWIMKVKCNHKNGVQRTTVCSTKLSKNINVKCRETKRNVEKGKEIQRNAEKCREIQRNAEKCREMKKGREMQEISL